MQVYDGRKRHFTQFMQPEVVGLLTCITCGVHEMLPKNYTETRCSFCFTKYLSDVKNTLDDEINIFNLPDLHAIVVQYMGTKPIFEYDERKYITASKAARIAYKKLSATYPLVDYEETTVIE